MVTTVTADLVRLLEGGVRLDFGDPEKPVFDGVRPIHRSTLDPLLTPARKPATQHALRHVVRYRQTLLAMFMATATPTTTPATARQLWQDYAGLVDNLGPRLAEILFERIADEYERVSGRCALCGEPGCRRKHRQ
jgi:hypothetical protein